MKNHRFLRRAVVLVALLTTATGTIFAGDNFEGRVDMKITARSDQKTDARMMHYTLKGDKLRLDFDGDANAHQHGMNAAGVIVDFTKRETVTLIDSQDQSGTPRKMAIRRAMSDPKAKPVGTKTAEKHKGGEPVATGRTETIAGYSAAEYTVKDDDGAVTDLWLAKGLGNFISPDKLSARQREDVPPAWEKMLHDGGFFPLRVVSHDSDGAEVSRMEVVKIDKSPIPESVFSTEGYSEMQFPGRGERRNGGLGDKLKSLNPLNP